MANYRAIATGNWSNGATWAGGAVPPDAAGHNIYSNGFTVTIDQNVNVALITNAAITASFVGGGTSAVSGGSYSVSGAFNVSTTNLSCSVSPCLNVTTPLGTTTTFTGTINAPNVTGNNVLFSGTGMFQINTGNIYGGNSTQIPITNSSSGILEINTATIIGGSSGASNAHAIVNSSSGFVTCNTCTISGNIQGNGINNTGNGTITINSASTINGTSGNGVGINNSVTGVLNINNSAVTSASTVAVNNLGTITCIKCTFTANSTTAAITSTGTTRLSGNFVSAANGRQPINSAVWFLNSAPTTSYIQHALDGINSNSFVRFFTADTSLGQANPTDVRSGVSYASGNLAGRLTVPARGSVAHNVNYGPSMPFTATRSGTTATAALTYSYPLVVGDTITVTGASNTEWNNSYTIASVVSDTSVTFTVPATHSASAGTGALMQTTGTAVLDPAAVASAVWGAAARTITGGLVDTATTLTNAPTVPSVVQIRQEMDSNSTKLANLDTTVSSRLAPSGTLATVTDLTNAPSVPSAAQIASQVRTELAAELARVDAAISTRATQTNIDAIKAKTDLLNTDRLAQVSTVSTTGAQLAAALS
jgi:hypothetical protein